MLPLVERYGGAAEFLAAAEPWLLAAEADNNLLLSVAHLLTTNDHPFGAPVYFATVKVAGRIVGCALCPPPDGLEIGALPQEVAGLLVPSVAVLQPQLGSVSGNGPAVLEFARAWVAERGGAWRVPFRANLFRLDVVNPPRAVPGRLRLAEASEWELLASCAASYARDIDTHVDLTKLFARMLRRGGLYVWDDGGVKCVVGESGSTPNGMRVNAVYTPKEFRNRGYAQNAVAAVTERALRRGCEFCVLFAEHGLERVYEPLGYRRLREHLIVELRAAS